MARHRRALAITAYVLACCMTVGCVTEMSEVDLRTRLEQVSNQVPRRRAVRSVVPIHAATKMEAWVHHQEAKNDPESSLMSLQLAQGFAQGQRRNIDYFVGGPYPELANQIILNALAMNQGRALSMLRIVLVGPEEPTQELRMAAKARSARLMHWPEHWPEQYTLH